MAPGGNIHNGQFSVHFIFNYVLYDDVSLSWIAACTFSVPVTQMATYDFQILSHSADGKVWTVAPKQNENIRRDKLGKPFDLKIDGHYTGSDASFQASCILKNYGFGHDHQTLSPVTHSTGTKYDYDDVLMKSILFYEAQRSGKLPPDNRIPWRADSALNDRGDNGEDLTGGWYDAGDNVKFGFPMSASVTLLAWGLLEYKDAYEKAGQLEYMYKCIRWPVEWMLKCHTGPTELYVQVGDGGRDHGFWGRPEDMTMARPAFKITESRPGSDVASEYAAAMAASYLVFKDKDPAFANKLLTHAKQIYTFAEKFKGKYSDAVTNAAAFYRSVNYNDELSWGALWLHKATNDSSYLPLAEKYYALSEPPPAWAQSWDEKNTGNMILLYEATGKSQYKQDIESTFTSWMPGGTVPYTPKGLGFRLQWGSLRYASNMAFMALLAADAGIHSTEYRRWAKSQIHYALGDTGRSFVVGFGTNPPQRPHHRASSCPMIPVPCSPNAKSLPGPNPHTLYGALVGGPDQSGKYEDNRDNYVMNEVACDYNAGFQSAVAGLEHLSLTGDLP